MSGPRVRVVSGGVGSHTKVFVGDQMLTNCAKVELVIDARGIVRAVLHLHDIDVDAELFGEDTIVMVHPVDEKPANITVRMDSPVRVSEEMGREIVRELRRLNWRRGDGGVAV